MSTHAPGPPSPQPPPRRASSTARRSRDRSRGSRTRSSSGTPTSSAWRSSGSRRAVCPARLPPAEARRGAGRVEPAFGTLDITFHRDDVHVRDGGGRPADSRSCARRASRSALEGKTVVLVDDVLYTGRTIRAAIDALLEFGRPARVQLAVLVDRGHRELPIRPDYVGKNLPTARDERIQVELVEVDEVDRVLLVREPEDGDHG